MTRARELFASKVRDVLSQRCVKCHGGEKTKGDLDMTSREGLLKPGADGPVVVPGSARTSRLYKLITHQEEPHMPASGARLSDQQIHDIEEWINLGAAYDRPLITKANQPAAKVKTVSQHDREGWAYRPLADPPVPPIKNAAWCQTPIDAFIQAKLEQAGLTPNEPLDRRRLIRRAYFDLIGLPPTPEEVDAFVADPSPNAFEKVIDRLLASPHYGERWARHWLDIARFAESHGFEHDYDRPTAYHYRDFVIKALNQDMPYTTFVRWQLDGDKLAPDDPLAWMATGFLAAGVHSTQITKNQVEKERYDELDDMTRTLGTAMLGMTVGCARCHDHKFDPIPTADYYRMIASFTKTVRSEKEFDLEKNPALTAERERYRKQESRLVAELGRYEKEQLPGKLDSWLAARKKNDSKAAGKAPREGKIPKPVQTILAAFDKDRAKPITPTDKKTLLAWFGPTEPGWQSLNGKLLDLRKHAPPPLTKVLVCSEGLPALRLHTQGADFFEDTYFLNRGDPNQKKGVAQPGYLHVLMRAPEEDKRWEPADRTNPRHGLADWITDVDNGAGNLLARVMVNRMWQHHLGRGIVATPSDFGAQGEKPSHPELLDWLATRLIRADWRLKAIHKLIMMSAVYQESSAAAPEKIRIDQEDRLFWRRIRHRLEAETIRDTLLSVSGTLDSTMYGPGTLDPEMKRRSIYFFVKRSKLVPMMVLFDGPDALQGLERRATTTIAPQALLMMNNPTVREYAEGFSRRIGAGAKGAAVDGIRLGYRLALGRAPTAREEADATEFLARQEQEYKAGGHKEPAHQALADFCQAFFCLNEFIYID
jgi:cytochrome c553